MRLLVLLFLIGCNPVIDEAHLYQYEGLLGDFPCYKGAWIVPADVPEGATVSVVVDIGEWIAPGYDYTDKEVRIFDTRRLNEKTPYILLICN